jgi:hypothetical protein
VAVWGWGRDEATAKREAVKRLERLIERLRRGEPFPDAYAYGSRPLREEIVQVLDGESEDQPHAVLTRNRYGATVLNTTRLLFLDIDLPAPTLLQRLRRLFAPWRSCEDEAALAMPLRAAAGAARKVDGAARQQFSTWLGRYELAARKYATCRYIETIGSGRLKGTAD